MLDLTHLLGGTYASKTHDCWAVCRGAVRAATGKELPDYAALYHDANVSQEAAMAIWRAIQEDPWEQVDQPEPWDIIVFRIGRFACHAGAYIGDGDFIHCLAGRNTVIENLSSAGWQEKVTGVYRWTGT